MENPELGVKQVPFGKELWIEREDFMEEPPKKYFRLFPGNEVRLMNAYFVKCVGFEKDENGKVTDIKKRTQGLGENLIEDFMIASNESTIEIITSLCDTGLYRIHGKPSPKKIEEFVKFVSSLGYKLTGKYDYNNITNKDIQKMLKELKGTKDEEILNKVFEMFKEKFKDEFNFVDEDK